MAIANPSSQEKIKNEDQKRSQIFFDGNCIVCDLEANSYYRRHPHLFEIVDISSDDFKASHHNLDANDVNLHMHVKTPDGQVVKGVEAFAHIWSRIPSLKWASRLILSGPVKPIALVGYEIFARNRRYLPKKRRS